MVARAIIDSDSYMWRAALTCNTLVELGKDMFYEAWDLNKARVYLKETMASLTTSAGCGEYVMVTAGKGINYRKHLYPTYKSNRKKEKRPLMLDKVRDMCKEEFPMVSIPHLEADDTCRILLEEDKNNVVVSIDKDLRTFSGKIYDSYHNEMRFINRQQAEANFKRQLLMGDKTDGYDGLPKVGLATANKLILDGVTIDEIAQMYIDKGLGIEEFKKVYNCAKILGKDDYKRGVIMLYGGEKFDCETIRNTIYQ